jgi:lipid-A-disaccharide synthase
VDTLERKSYLKISSKYKSLSLRHVKGMTYDVMKNADLLLVASGTATLESAILGTPMIVIYRTSMLSYLIGKAVVKIPNIALANVVAGRKVVPEYIQRSAKPERIAEEALKMLDDGKRMSEIRKALLETREKLGEGGAARRVAGMAMEIMSA